MIRYGVVPTLAGRMCSVWEHDLIFFFQILYTMQFFLRKEKEKYIP